MASPRITCSLMFSICLSSIAVDGPSLQAESPAFLKIFRPSQPSEQVTDDELRLKAEHGPWLILAASLEGSESQSIANELAKELRQKYQLNAYVLPKQFDYSQTVPGSGIEANGRQRRMRYIADRKIDGYGILVGDFTSLEDPQLKETLKRIKKMQPTALASKPESEHSVAAYQRLLRSKSNDQDYKLAGAFITRNPLLPEDFFQAPVVDKFVQSLNRNAKHSLLEAQGRFTVRVATFRGEDQVVLNNSRAAQNASANGASDQLEFAAFQANLAAEVLRNAGFEAYEFHDRNSSIVTIGSFDSLGSENEAGQFVYSPEILKAAQEFGGAKETRNSQYGPVPVPKNLLDIVNYRKIPELLSGTEAEKLAKVKQYSVPFDLEPKPMAIPRLETSKLYINSLLGKN
jgi:hypothetical protein